MLAARVGFCNAVQHTYQEQISQIAPERYGSLSRDYCHTHNQTVFTGAAVLLHLQATEQRPGEDRGAAGLGPAPPGAHSRARASIPGRALPG